MKCVKSSVKPLIAMENIHYSECFQVPKGTKVPGADPTKTYMRVQTDQRYVKLSKEHQDLQHLACARAISLQDSVLIAIPLNTLVQPLETILQWREKE